MAAFGKFIQAMSLANLAVIYDKAFVVDETVEDVAALELVPYDQVWAAADAKFAEAIQMAGGARFEIPSIWVAFNGAWSGSYMAEVARAYRARYRTQVPRTPSEREAVDWSAVLQAASAGISKDFSGYYEEGGNWAWHRSKLHTATYSGWARIDYRDDRAIGCVGRLGDLDQRESRRQEALQHRHRRPPGHRGDARQRREVHQVPGQQPLPGGPRHLPLLELHRLAVAVHL